MSKINKSIIEDILGKTEDNEKNNSGRKGPGFRIVDELSESIEDKVKKNKKGLSM